MGDLKKLTIRGVDSLRSLLLWIKYSIKLMNKNKTTQSKICFRQRIILVLFGLFLVFVFLEASLRLGGFILLSMQEYRNSQSIKQKGVYRIMCLGESTTRGQYPQFLEQALNQRNIGARFSVIDKGMGGKNTSIIISKVESYIDEYHPDAVVAMMGINDRGEYIPFEAATTSKGMLLIRPFRTYKLTRLLWLHILAKAKEIGFYKPSEDRWSFKKNQTYFSGIGLKEVPDGSISTEDLFKKTIALNPKDDKAYVELGWFYLTQFKFSQAEGVLRKAIELNPKNDDAYVKLGWFYHEQKKFSQAEGVLRKAIELNPKNDDAYVKLGWFYHEQKKFSQAEGVLRKAIELNPKNDDAYVKLGWFYHEQKKFSQAEGVLRKAIELNPKNDKAYGAASSSYKEMGRSGLAKEYDKKANSLRLEYYLPLTVNNYRKLKEILDKRGIRLVCVQYPVRNIEPLKKIFQEETGNIIFVDNERVFKEALKKASYKKYFRDMFAGDFGHCTEKGNQLLAQNIANTILKEIFGK